MTQEEKDLLLKDLCARLPYGIRLKIGEHSDYTLCGYMPHDEHPIKVKLIENEKEYIIEVYIEHIKPYLRPMSSMTEEEQDEIKEFTTNKFRFKNKGIDNTIPRDESEWSTVERRIITEKDSSALIDYLNSHYFDYRGLIKKGLALEAPERMYNV